MDATMVYHFGGWAAFLKPKSDMKYNGFYFWMFKSPMKKVLAEKYGMEYAADIMKEQKGLS